MIVAERLRDLRLRKKFSQGEIGKRTGMRRCYISRVENGHTVPSIETMERFARALEVPLYHLFYDGEQLPQPPHLPELHEISEKQWGDSGADAKHLAELRNLLSQLSGRQQKLVLTAVQKLAGIRVKLVS